jgi:selenocysteine-specific elongation factor
LNTNDLTYHTIGIAGHIDHGKTTLTKQLTGIDTDRLKEERERSISIELGFAPCTLPGGETVGVVDVPGHERFIRQMIAGAAGIDLVLLVIAADEGVMPQTREHADILGFLGIHRGIIVLTKTYIVDSEWLAMVREEVKEWADTTFLSGAPIVAVSGKTGAGIDLLKQEMQTGIASIPSRKQGAPARMPIDRAFKIKGAGTIVTGTVYEGTIAEGDSLQLLPDGGTVRVRQVHVHHKQVSEAFAGQRAAVNITGGQSETAARGATLAAPGYFQMTERIDVRLAVLKSLSFSVKQRARVRLHIGTSEVMGTVIFFDRNVLEPGEETVCQLQLEQGIVTKKGEPFILRRLSPMATIGGGQVIDPYAERHRFGEETASRLRRLAEGDPREQLEQYLEQVQFATVDDAMQQLAVNEEEMLAILRQKETILSIGGSENVSGKEGRFLLLASTLERWMERVEGELKEYHEKHPLRPGMGKAALKSARFKNTPEQLWRLFIQWACRRGKLAETADVIFLPSFTAQFPERHKQAMEQALLQLERAGITPPAWNVLMEEYKIPEAAAGDLKAYLLNKGEIVQISDEFYIYRKEWDRGIEKLQSSLGKEPVVTPAAAKEVLGLSRKYLIPFLESLDKNNITRRTEEGRIWKKNN